MNLQDLRTLVDYHYWARDRLLDAIEPLSVEQLNRDLGSSFTSIRETVVHIYAAEWAWHERWQGRLVYHSSIYLDQSLKKCLWELEHHVYEIFSIWQRKQHQQLFLLMK